MGETHVVAVSNNRLSLYRGLLCINGTQAIPVLIGCQISNKHSICLYFVRISETLSTRPNNFGKFFYKIT